MARITVTLSDEEWKLVRRLADAECRPPRMQARLMLRRAIERALETGQENSGVTGGAVAGRAGDAPS